MRNNDDESSQEPLALKLLNSAFKMTMKDTRVIHNHEPFRNRSSLKQKSLLKL